MISFSSIDYIIVVGFFIILILLGLAAAKNKPVSSDDYLLSGRKVGLLLFVLTNVATWYGGILGVGEFSYRYGIVSWATQGLPYYIFAFLFALFFADKIRSANLYTIPDKLAEVYGNKLGVASAVLIFILVSPAPYLLMLGQIISLIFDIHYFYSLLVASFAASVYLIFGGYKSNIWADAFSFFIMFGGFISIVIIAYLNFGGADFLSNNLPPLHLTFTGGNSLTFIVVWFLIALWTFTDPGFHQRCYSARSGYTAKWGIIISIIFWIFFDFLTNTSGLFSKAIIPDMENPVLAFPYLADKIMDPGLKGLFFAALIATVISTLNSFVFLSATTFGRDFIYRIKNISNPQSSDFIGKTQIMQDKLISYTKAGIIITLIISIFIAYFFHSVVELWYILGTICIPGLIFLVVSSYYQKLKVSKKVAFFELLFGVSGSVIWLVIRNNISDENSLIVIEPMIIGLIIAALIHFIGISTSRT